MRRREQIASGRETGIARAAIALMLLGIFWGIGLAQAGADAGWQAAWENTLAAARKEGQVAVYFWQGGNLEKAIQAFQKKHPEIRVTTVSGRGSSFIARITAEMRAGKQAADVCMCGVTSPYEVLHKRAKALSPLKPALILPEVLDESRWWQEKHHFQDPEGRYIFVYWGRPSATRVSYNSNRVKPQELGSYRELLGERWKGKIVAVDPNESAGGWRGLYYKPELGAEFLRRLFGEMDVTMTRQDRQAVDWLAVGKFSLGLFLAGVPEAKAQGLPVDEFKDTNFKESPNLDTGPNGTLVLMRDAPHPHAAQLFINWFLSREGQITYQEVMNNPLEYVESMREDIPKDPIPVELRRRRGVRYVPMFIPERIDPAPIVRLYKETTRR